MQRASPVELRKALAAAQGLANIGVMFVPVPVFTEEDQARYAKEADGILAKAANAIEAESEEKQ